MLAGLCRTLASAGWHVTVVGRDRAKLARATDGDSRLHPLSVDYEDVGAFASALAEAAAARGPITLAVCWIRSWAPQSLLAAADAVVRDGRLFHVLGSQAGDASASAIDAIACRPDLHYHQVQLGAVDEGTTRRWLMNDEISAGVYEAIAAARQYHLVGTVAP
jgi:NAD(P)-dependent dehydrogenase (short-subunit alcohol dehydrogenase family)